MKINREKENIIKRIAFLEQRLKDNTEGANDIEKEILFLMASHFSFVSPNDFEDFDKAMLEAIEELENS